MHERKAVMSGMADAFIALPGGLGTLMSYLKFYAGCRLGFIRSL